MQNILFLYINNINNDEDNKDKDKDKDNSKNNNKNKINNRVIIMVKILKFVSSTSPFVRFKCTMVLERERGVNIDNGNPFTLNNPMT